MRISTYNLTIKGKFLVCHQKLLRSQICHSKKFDSCMPPSFFVSFHATSVTLLLTWTRKDVFAFLLSHFPPLPTPDAMVKPTSTPASSRPPAHATVASPPTNAAASPLPVRRHGLTQSSVLGGGGCGKVLAELLDHPVVHHLSMRQSRYSARRHSSMSTQRRQHRNQSTGAKR